jgi:hypothetical protein
MGRFSASVPDTRLSLQSSRFIQAEERGLPCGESEALPTLVMGSSQNLRASQPFPSSLSECQSCYVSVIKLNEQNAAVTRLLRPRERTFRGRCCPNKFQSQSNLKLSVFGVWISCLAPRLTNVKDVSRIACDKADRDRYSDDRHESTEGDYDGGVRRADRCSSRVDRRLGIRSELSIGPRAFNGKWIMSTASWQPKDLLALRPTR